MSTHPTGEPAPNDGALTDAEWESFHADVTSCRGAEKVERTYHPLAGDEAATERHPGMLTRCLHPACMVAATPVLLVAEDALRDEQRERLHDDNCGCGEWDSHSEEYVAAMDRTIDAVMWPLRTATAPEIASFDAALRQAGHVPDAATPSSSKQLQTLEQGTEGTDYRTAVARAIHEASWRPDGTAYTAETLADAVLSVRDAEVARLRKRIHEAVDETQRRYGKFQSRCHEFDVWSAWARDQFAQGNLLWGSQSEATRLVVLSYIEEAERAKAEVARLRAELAEAQRELTLAAAEAEDARDGGLDIAHDLAETRHQWAEEAAASVRLPDDWRQQISDCSSSGVAVDLIESWRGGTAEEGQ